MFQQRKGKARWRPAKEAGVMNATERRFESHVLKIRLFAGEIERYEYEPWKIRYGTDFKATYTPDFVVFRADGEIELIDVKGSAGWETETRNKIKACARIYPEFHWVGYVEKRGKSGVFSIEEF